MPEEKENQNQEEYSPPEQVKFERKEQAKPGIPTASLPDIVFMLLLFFMVSTVFKEFKGLNVTLPSAKKIEKLPGKRNVSYVWIDQKGRISIDDNLVDTNQVSSIMYKKRKENPRIVVSLKIDKMTDMGVVTDVQQELREADALKINYSAKFGE